MGRNSKSIKRASTLPVRFAGLGDRDEALRRPARRQSPARDKISADYDDSTAEGLAANVARIAREQQVILRRLEGRGRSRRSASSSSRSGSHTQSRSQSREGINLTIPPPVGSSSDRSYSPRPRSRGHPSHYRVVYISSDESNDSDSDHETYNFELSSSNTSFISRDSTVAATSNKEASDEGRRDPLTGTKVPDNAYNVVRARYSWEESVGGQHQAELMVIEEQRKHKSSLYRWIHFSDQNIDKFKNSVLALPDLGDEERSAVSRLLGRVRRPLDTTLRPARSLGAWYLQPGYDKEEVKSSSGFQQRRDKSQTITWICFPYFSLDKYSSKTSKVAQSTESYPVRTLLQGHSSSVFEDRDLQQAVCKVAGGKADFCYYLPQVWYLVISDCEYYYHDNGPMLILAAILVSCSSISIDDLRASSISLTKIPPPVAPSLEGQKVLVSYGVSLLWSFNLNDCLTWFNLISRFAEFWPERISLLHSEKLLTAELWLRLVNRAKTTHENIKLNLQRSGRERPRLKGILSDRANLTATVDDGFKQDVDVNESMPQELRQMHTTTEARPANDVGSSVHLDKFFVFHWLSERDSHRMSENRLREDLKAIDIFLKKSTDLDERSIYTTCSSLEWEDVVRPLRSQADLLRKSSASTESEDEKERRRIHSIKVDVYNAAESLFEFFLPLLTRGATIDRFWGALGSLLESMGDGENGNARSSRHKQRQIASYSERDLYAICDGLNSLLYIAKPFQDLFSHATREDRAGLQRPNELAKAWLHIVMALAYASEYSELWADHLRSAEKLLRTGTKMVVQSINKRSILHNSVVMPHEIANLVNFGLLHDICSIEKNESGNITQTYRTYLEKLRSEMLRSPLFRGHQDNILLLKQEIAVILETLAAQRQVFLNRDSYNDQNRSRPRTYNRMREEDDDDYGHRSRSHRVPERTTSKRYDQSYHHQYSMGPPPPDTNIVMAGGVINIDLSPTDPGGYRDLLMQECLRLVNKKITDFEKMDEEAKDLEAWNILRIETNKDRQDVAIYTFTVVTIIFLPLSTVASILGMNTYDVRNMEQRQWVFWTVAIPLLVLVIFLCLVWTGELSNFWTGFKNLFRKDNRQITRRSERLGYDRIGDELAALSLEVPPEQFQRERSRYQYVDSDQYSTDPVNRIVLAPGDLYSQRTRVRSHPHHHRRSSYARQRSR